MALFASGRLTTLPIRTFGKADGLPTKECSSGRNRLPGVAAPARCGFPTKGPGGGLSRGPAPNTNHRRW